MSQKLPGPLLAIRSFGAVTNIGNSSAQTIASWVSQARRMRRIRLDGFADPFTVADCPMLTEGKTGVDRLFALIESAVAEALETSPVPDPPVRSLNLLLVPLWLGEDARQQVAERLSALWPAGTASFATIAGGSATSWRALEHAHRALATEPQLQRIVIAAVDSLCEPAVLRQAAEAGELLQAGNSQGFVAGEAAACVVLERVRDITELPADQFALHRPALAQQAERWWPSVRTPKPEALVAAVSGALKHAGMQATNISHLLSDMDGSDWRAQLESHALSRTLFLETGGLPQWRPATLLGQIGTPTGLLGWLLPVLAHSHHIERINTVLNWAIDPAGETAACVLERSPH